MAELKDAIEYVFTWHSMADACKDCQILHSRKYHGQDIFGHVLEDAQFGPIWDLDANYSLMHGGVGTCRCFLEVTVEKIEIEKLDSWIEFCGYVERML